MDRRGSPDAVRRRGVPARRDRWRTRRARPITQRAPVRRTAMADAGGTGAAHSPQHHCDCVQNSESGGGLQDTVPCRPGRELHPHMRADARDKEHSGARMRLRCAQRGKMPARDAHGARCGIGAQEAGGRWAGRGVRDETRCARIGAMVRCGGMRGRVTPRRARTATGAWRGEDDVAGGLHGMGRNGTTVAPVSVRERHREPLARDLLHVG